MASACEASVCEVLVSAAVESIAISVAVLHAHVRCTAMLTVVPLIEVVHLLLDDLPAALVSHGLHQPGPKFPTEP